MLIPDAPPGNWVDSFAPKPIRPYLRLARIDRPIGGWLLLWPAWWSVALASREAPIGWRWAVTGAGATAEGIPDPILLLALLVGAFAMRAAGCTYNDIVDRKIDSMVLRTANRPIPSGEVSIILASIFACIMSLIGLSILLTFNLFTIILGFSSVILILIYPFAKRFTHWPQLILGLAFNWGALLGWAAIAGELTWAPFILYMGGVFWTLGYDTIYAHMDKSNDIEIGVGSSAIALGNKTKYALTIFYIITLTAIITAGWLTEIALAPFLALLLSGAAQLTWQVIDLKINNPEDCLSKFRSNHIFGILVFVAIIGGHLFGAQTIGGAGTTDALFISA